MRRTSALIAGGGPAGAATAITLARAGMKPLLIERHAEPHDVVCGGFLGRDALAALDRLGLDPFALGARPITRLGLFTGAIEAEVALPFRAAGLSRRTLDEAMLRHAARLGAGMECGTAIRSCDIGTKMLTLGDSGTISGDAIFLATGKHELRGVARDAPSDADSPVGLRIALEPSSHLAHAMEGRIELFLFERGYAGLLLQDDGHANLCLTVARSRLIAADGSPHLLLAALAGECPALGERLAATASRSSWSTIARVPYGWRTRNRIEGLFRIGDQAAVIASLAGDGIAIALASSAAAAASYMRKGATAAPDFQRRFSRRAAIPLLMAHRLRALAERPSTAGMMVRVASRHNWLARIAARITRID